MKMQLNWVENMRCVAHGSGHSVDMDAKAPIGHGTALNPKQLLLSGLMGCTAIDVIASMKKHRQPMESFDIDAEVQTSAPQVHPGVFTAVLLRFRVHGAVDPELLLEAIRLSQSQYCGVSAMLSRAFPIDYEIFLNDEWIGKGKAQFTS